MSQIKDDGGEYAFSTGLFLAPLFLMEALTHHSWGLAIIGFLMLAVLFRGIHLLIAQRRSSRV